MGPPGHVEVPQEGWAWDLNTSSVSPPCPLSGAFPGQRGTVCGLDRVQSSRHACLCQSPSPETKDKAGTQPDTPRSTLISPSFFSASLLDFYLRLLGPSGFSLKHGLLLPGHSFCPFFTTYILPHFIWAALSRESLRTHSLLLHLHLCLHVLTPTRTCPIPLECVGVPHILNFHTHFPTHSSHEALFHSYKQSYSQNSSHPTPRPPPLWCGWYSLLVISSPCVGSTSNQLRVTHKGWR